MMAEEGENWQGETESKISTELWYYILSYN